MAKDVIQQNRGDQDEASDHAGEQFLEGGQSHQPPTDEELTIIREVPGESKDTV